MQYGLNGTGRIGTAKAHLSLRALAESQVAFASADAVARLVDRGAIVCGCHPGKPVAAMSG